MTDNNSEIMKFEEVMEYLNIGKSTLYRLLRNNEITSFKIGKVWKIPRQSVEEYVKNSLSASVR
ncbi:MAG: helix-turn-helix domain-containing protein [Ruminococcus sp.]